MGKFTDLPISTKLFKNLDEESLTASFAAMENAFITEAGGISRFPGMRVFKDFGNGAPVYLGSINNDMISVSSDGNSHRLDKTANSSAIPGAQVLGGRRVIFTKDKSNLYMAAGSQIIAYDGEKNTVLSDDAPNASHVAAINSFLIANEVETQLWFNSGAADPRTWDGQDVFAADAKPDNVTALIITDFNEIIAAGPESIQQYDRLVGGTSPFILRWSVGDGVSEPYTTIFADNAVWALNQAHEFCRYSGQTGAVQSGDVGRDIASKFNVAHNDTFDNAWAAPIYANGENFIILQLPTATNDYGSKGITYLFDIRQNKACQLYGWDDDKKLPNLWPGVSILKLWGRTYIGGYGKIYELTDNVDKKPTDYSIDNEKMRMYLRTAHYSDLGLIRIDSVKVTMKRGKGQFGSKPRIGMRVNRDDRGFGLWQWMELGESGHNNMVLYFGDQGEGDTWQFEFLITDDIQVEIRKIEAEVTPIVR